MKSKLFQIAFVVLSFISFGILAINQFQQPIVSHNVYGSKVIDKMPLIIGDHFEAYSVSTKPIAQRSIRFRKYLAASVQILVSRARGSGTIVYYNKKDKIAYVQTCGHLWDGNMDADEGKNKKCKILVWYHNNKKLTSPKSYEAKVIYYSNNRGKDVGLLTFRPDWEPEYFPIAEKNYEIKKDDRLHSLGCDNGKEVAHYFVRVLGYNNSPDLVTTENSPRPGRSGGGLMTTSGYFVGICWGTSDYSGNGNGYFTTLKSLRKSNEENGYGWLNNVSSFARKLPIIDKNNTQGEYPDNYIPIPQAA